MKKAIILSAGFGERMRPLTETLPKPLLPVAGVPVIRRTIAMLSSFGITGVVINLHHLSPLIKNEFEHTPPRIEVSFSEEPEILGTAGGIKAAASFLNDEDIIVINSDIIADVNIHEAVRFHREKRALCTMVLREDSEADRHGPVEIDREGKVRRFLGRPHDYTGAPLAKYMFTGIQIVSPPFLERIPSGRYCDSSKEVFPGLVEKGENLYGYVMKGEWIDIGTPRRYLEANWREMRKGAIQDSPRFIGEGCTIEKGAEVSGSVIMDGVSIGEGAKIIGSIIGPSVSIPPGKRVERKIAALVNGKVLERGF